MTVKNFHHNLGKLETEVMGVMWHKKNASVREVLGCLSKQRAVAYTTIMTVMTRLVDKGVLRRKLIANGSYLYKPAQDKQTFFARRSKSLIKNLINEFGEVAVAQFIDVVEDSGSKDLAKWQKKLKKIK